MKNNAKVKEDNHLEHIATQQFGARTLILGKRKHTKQMKKRTKSKQTNQARTHINSLQFAHSSLIMMKKGKKFRRENYK